MIVPKTTYNILPDQVAVGLAPQRVLIVGQKTAAGTATSGQLVENILNDNSENTLFGEDSLIAAMVRAYKEENKITAVDAIPLDDAGGATDATGTVVFSGTATEAGTLVVTVGSDKNHKYEIAVANGDTATVIGAALETAVNADTKAPADAANVTGTVTMTAVNGGEEGNNIGLRVTGSVAGITHSVTAMSGGATNPTLTNILDVVGNRRYQSIIWPTSFSTTELESFLNSRFNVNNNVLDGVGFLSVTDTFANLLTASNENSQSISRHVNQLINETSYKGSAIFELDSVVISRFVALRALRQTEDSNLTGIVVTTASRDQFGGAALASLPYHNTPISNLPIIDIDKEFTQIEIDQLNDAGVWVMQNNQPANELIVGDVVTTYKNNAAGVPDPTYKFLNVVDTASAIRELYVNRTRQRFAQTRLTLGIKRPGRDEADKPMVEAFLDGVFQDLASPEYTLVDDGEQALQFYKSNRTVEFDKVEGKVTISMLMPIVTQVREIQGTIQISFSNEARIS